MNKKIKLILSIIGGSIFFILALLTLKFFNDRSYRSQLPEYPDFQAFSKSIQKQMKAAGRNAFLNPTNDFDFTALPGGTRLYSGYFPEFGNSYAVWWTATEYSSLAAHNWGLHDSSSRVFNGYDSKQSGFSVRCVMD